MSKNRELEEREKEIWGETDDVCVGAGYFQRPPVEYSQEPPVCKFDYLISVDYRREIDDMLSSGRYLRLSYDITSENFPSESWGVYDVKFKLVKIKKKITKEEVLELFKGRENIERADLKKLVKKKEVYEGDVLKHLRENRMRPATLKELLAFGERCLEHPILCLGSKVEGYDIGIGPGYEAPCLFKSEKGRRHIGLVSCDLPLEDYLHLAVVY